MTTSHLHALQHSYSQHLCFNYQRHMSQVIVSRKHPTRNIYIGGTPTTEHDQSYPNVFHQPFFYLQMYKEYILTTIRFPLVYDNDPKYNFFIFQPPGKQDHLTVNIHFQLSHLNGIHTEEVDLLKFKRTNDLPPWYLVFQIPYQVKAKVYHSAHTTLIKLIYINKSQDHEMLSPYI